MTIIKKITFYSLSFLIVLSTVQFSINSAKAVTGCADIQQGFVTSNLQIEDLSTGQTGGAFATSSYSPDYGTANYTEGGDVSISMTGGGNSQADVPVNVSMTGFTSDEGNTYDFSDYGYSVPGQVVTFHNFRSNQLTLSATQCGSDNATVYLTLNPIVDPNSRKVSTTANLAIYEKPSVALTINGSASATIPVGGTATLAWTPTATTSGTACTPSGAGTPAQPWASSGPKASTPGTTYTASTGVMNTQGIYTYTLTCLGGPPSAQVSSAPPVSVTLTVGTPPDYTVRCDPSYHQVFQGDITSFGLTPEFKNGFGSNIHWTVKSLTPTAGAPTIDITENDLTDDTIAADVYTNALGTYTIVFSATGGGITHDCPAVYVEVISAPSPSPVTVNADASVCGKVTLNWNIGTVDVAHPAPTGFKVYRGSETDPDGPSFVVISGASALGPNVRTYTDSANPPSSNNYYKVRAFNGAYSYADSAVVLGNSTPCAPRLDRSNKQLISVSGHHTQTFTSNPCGTGTLATLRNNSIFVPGDVVKFQLNICNSGTADMTSVIVNDSLFNPANANTQYSLELKSNTISSVGNCATAVGTQLHSVSFNIANIPAPTNTNNPTYCSITMEATIVAPPSPTGNFFRFQNVADIMANGLTQRISTPPYLFSINGAVPNRYETAPQ